MTGCRRRLSTKANLGKLILNLKLRFGILNMAFNEISQTSELDDLFAQSAETPVILFKHSLTCPISHAAYEEMSNLTKEEISLIVVQDARAVSNEIAARTGIRHESPQTMIVKEGKVAWHAAHYDITKTAVTRALEELGL